ncbi:MAG: hypothetical protein IJ127_24115 [Afipia sp.]|jgi:hypothetical protein|nr:hypothetical protein [Afipia sp.]MBS4005089.1 hypothetical protein [Afipia sp.]WIG51612.1 MAG: hypothetical protein OJF48_002529 [Afipia sp.]
MFTAFLEFLPYVLGAALYLFLLAGFWRGLTPHKEGHRPRQSIHWWYGPRD